MEVNQMLHCYEMSISFNDVVTVKLAALELFLETGRVCY